MNHIPSIIHATTVTLIAVVLGAVLILPVGGCTNAELLEFAKTVKKIAKDPCEGGQCLQAANYEAADTLVKNLKSREIAPDKRIVLVSFVDSDDLGITNTFGRLAPLQISSRIAQNGFTTVELKHRTEDVIIRPGTGEFALSRTMRDAVKAQSGYAVLTGTYTVGFDTVYVNARIIRVVDNVVLAGADYSLSGMLNVRRMIPGLFDEEAVGLATARGIRPSVQTELSALSSPQAFDFSQVRRTN